MIDIEQRNLRDAFVRNIAIDLVLTILTLYLWNLRVQYVQIRALNKMLGQQKYSFLKWGLLCLVTFGFYHIYHEYRTSLDLRLVMPELTEMEPLIAVVLTCMGFALVADAIQQYHINHYYGQDAL